MCVCVYTRSKVAAYTLGWIDWRRDGEQLQNEQVHGIDLWGDYMELSVDYGCSTGLV